MRALLLAVVVFGSGCMDDTLSEDTAYRRLVDTYVSAGGIAAYLDDEAAIPVGTVLVKTSMEADGTPGPLFVMEKRAAGADADRDDWAYAIHWADPPARWS